MQEPATFTFLICSERSGSNLITRIINSHPEYCGPSPSHMIRTFANNRIRYGDLSNQKNWHILLTDVADLLNAQFGKWRTQWTVEHLKDEIEEPTLAAVIRHIYTAEAQANQKKRVFIKENQTFRFLPFLLLSFPEAKFVFQVRDPRDMILSWKLSPNHPGGVYKGARIWKEDQAHSLDVYGYLLEAGKIFLSKYETVVTEPYELLPRLCDFLEVPFSDAMLEFHRDDLTIENSERINDWQNLRKPLLSNNTAKYRGKLSELEIRYIESYCQSEMAFLGYQPDYEIAEDITPLEQELLELEKAMPTTTVELTEEENAIREKRLSVIYRIIARKL